MKPAIAALSLAILAVPAHAVTVDGTRDAAYGPALAVQTVQTGFGNNFSEWNAAYATIESGKLYLMLTGNLEANFNRLEIFIDSKAGGQAIFDSSGNDNAGRMDGLVFDNGFTADYHVIARRGTDIANPKFDLDFANLTAQSASGYFDILAGGASEGAGTTGTGVNAFAIEVGMNNANVAGIGGTTGAAADQAAAQAVSTGLEIAINLLDLGYVAGPLNIMVGQNNSGHDYWSNQFLAGLPVGTGNLGGDETGGFTGEGAVDLTHFAGNQYFTVNPIPEPATLTLLATCLATLSLRRKRS